MKVVERFPWEPRTKPKSTVIWPEQPKEKMPSAWLLLWALAPALVGAALAIGGRALVQFFR